ncbi:MAG: histidine phosphatase family protein [Eubacteriales bacterium]|jgi:probable phosphoglycerate mutase
MYIYVIRHGETSWNKEVRLQGQHGADLDEKGVLLAEITSKALKDVPFDICYTSPLIRARHTAEIMVGDRNIPIIDDKRLMEISFGVWEGLHVGKDNMEIPAERFDKFNTDSYNYEPPEGGESIQDVIHRTADFYQDLINKPGLQDSVDDQGNRVEKTVLVSTHGCAGRALLHSVYEDTSTFWHGGVPMNCAVSVIRVTGGVGKIIQHDKVYYPKQYCHDFYEGAK